MISFANYTTGYQAFRSMCKPAKQKPTYADYLTLAAPEIIRRQGSMGRIQLAVEDRWMKASQPYYKVWPAIASALLKVRLDLDSKLFSVPLGTICLRFPVHLPPPITDVTAILADDTVKVDPKNGSRGLTIVYKMSDKTREGFLGLALIPGESVQDALDRAGMQTSMALQKGAECADTLKLRYDEWQRERGVLCLKAVLSVCLLASDPELILPDVLVDDRRRFDESTDLELRQRLIDKAALRGVVGWRIGEAYETVPHFRRPHFALRHTGKGGTIPRIVPVKGAIVHRQRVTTVPTGFIEDDGTEVEN